jgi:hypothetical protein
MRSHLPDALPNPEPTHIGRNDCACHRRACWALPSDARRYVKQNPAEFAGINSADQAATIKDLNQVHRLYQVTPNDMGSSTAPHHDVHMEL